MCDFFGWHCGTVTGSGGLLQKSFFSESDWMLGSMDPPCLRSRNSWRIRSNWDSNARPDLLAVEVGCCQRKELPRGISNLCMGWWGNAKLPDVSWYFLHVHQEMFVDNFQVVLAVSVIPLHCFWWLLHGFPLPLTSGIPQLPWRNKSEVELRKYCCPILQCLMDEPVVAEAWALRFIHFTANGRLQLNTQKKNKKHRFRLMTFFNTHDDHRPWGSRWILGWW